MKKTRIYKRKKKRTKKKRTKKKSENPEDEYELQSAYHKWYATKFPSTTSCGTPYCNMARRTATKVKMKGYLPGYPDYVELDPRVIILRKKNKIKIRFYPGKVIEFKSPNGKGRVSKNQKNVLSNLENRGFLVSKGTNNLEDAINTTKNYKKKSIPVFKGWITINLKDGNVLFPSKRKSKVLPGRILSKHSNKMMKRRLLKRKRKKRREKRKR